MSDRQPTRAELIARIAASTKDAVVLQEMQRLGFWPQGSGEPGIEAALIEREAALVQRLNALQAELKIVGDPQAALQAMRRERMAASKARREAGAQAREQRRHERALQWLERSRDAIGHLGHGVSAGLNPQPLEADDRRRLEAAGLPVIDTPLALAQAMGIGVAELKFLCFHREVARTQHYRRFGIPKKTGGVRTISAPMPRLKRAQYWVLDALLAKVPLHAAARGFVPGRSIVSNAAPHAGRDLVINLDLKDFFPSITFARIKGVFRRLGYPEQIATLLGLLCSENVCDELQVDGERFYVGRTARERVLPQGAPTSPMLTNILCRRLDRRLQGVAAKLGFTYTRYADDLTFSASGEAAGRSDRLLRQVHFILREEGFTPHPDKQRVMRAASRQEVTGIVVNERPGVSREQRRALRAALHRAQQKGVEAATWQGQPARKDVLVGFAQFVAMVQPAQGQALLARAKALPSAGTKAAAAAPSRLREFSGQGKAPPRAAGPWWEPAPKPLPVLQKTAGQLREERRARLAEARALREGRPLPSTSTATGPVPNPPAAAPDDTPAKLGPVNWNTWLLQLIVMALMAVRLHSALFFMLGAFWMGARLLRRRFGWPSFLAVMLVIIVLEKLLPP